MWHVKIDGIETPVKRFYNLYFYLSYEIMDLHKYFGLNSYVAKLVQSIV